MKPSNMKILAAIPYWWRALTVTGTPTLEYSRWARRSPSPARKIEITVTLSDWNRQLWKSKFSDYIIYIYNNHQYYHEPILIWLKYIKMIVGLKSTHQHINPSLAILPWQKPIQRWLKVIRDDDRNTSMRHDVVEAHVVGMGWTWQFLQRSNPRSVLQKH